MSVRNVCPACGSHRYKKNGHTRHGKQNHQCKACHRQCTANPLDRSIAPEQRLRIEQLLTLLGNPSQDYLFQVVFSLIHYRNYFL